MVTVIYSAHHNDYLIYGINNSNDANEFQLLRNNHQLILDELFKAISIQVILLKEFYINTKAAHGIDRALKNHL